MTLQDLWNTSTCNNNHKIIFNADYIIIFGIFLYCLQNLWKTSTCNNNNKLICNRLLYIRSNYTVLRLTYIIKGFLFFITNL